MCDCDENPAVAFEQRNVRARKTHRCCECRQRRILPGSVHVVISGVWADSGPDRFRFCLRCWRVRQALIAELNKVHECAPCFGELRSELRERLRRHRVRSHTKQLL